MDIGISLHVSQQAFTQETYLLVDLLDGITMNKGLLQVLQDWVICLLLSISSYPTPKHFNTHVLTPIFSYAIMFRDPHNNVS